MLQNILQIWENSKIVPVLCRKSSFVLLFLVIMKWSSFLSKCVYYIPPARIRTWTTKFTPVQNDCVWFTLVWNSMSLGVLLVAKQRLWILLEAGKWKVWGKNNTHTRKHHERRGRRRWRLSDDRKVDFSAAVSGIGNCE